jgi:hypothetical protein
LKREGGNALAVAKGKVGVMRIQATSCRFAKKQVRYNSKIKKRIKIMIGSYWLGMKRLVSPKPIQKLKIRYLF